MSICLTPCVIIALILVILFVVIPRKHENNDFSAIFNVNLLINDTIPVASVDENFICATIDWWPQEKCDYGSCSWLHSTVLNLGLTNVLLVKAVQALSPLLIRIGGSLQDQVVYNVGSYNGACNTFNNHGNTTRFGFSTGCLNMSRWQEFNQFFQHTGSLMAFGLNALYGREGSTKKAWNSSNARDFISYTFDKNYNVKAWEFGNELSGKLDALRYAEDFKELIKVINDVYGETPKPILVAPDGFFDANWYSKFLQHTENTQQEYPIAVSIHVYNLGPGDGVGISKKILNSSYPSNVYERAQNTVQKYGNGAKVWVGESGGIFNSGQHLVSDTFVFSFWYLDQLGKAAVNNIQVFCRQTLIGGNYGLLDSNFNPNPDFYIAYLWKKLMGEVVLNVTLQGNSSSTIHAYGHCLKGSKGGLAVVILNYSHKVEYAINFEGILNTRKLEYHLTAADGNIQSSRVNLNGNILGTFRSGNIRDLKPVTVKDTAASRVQPHSILFMAFPDLLLPACTL